MIHGVFGANAYARRQAIAKLVGEYDEVESYDAEQVQVRDLPELLLGSTLFSSGKKAVVLRDASTKNELWKALEEWLPKVDDDTLVIVADTAPDKRTKTYKWLQKNATIVACDPWKPRDSAQAKAWVGKYCTLPSKVVDELVSRATCEGSDGKPIIDQEQLANAIDQLRVVSGDITPDMIDAVLPASTYDNVFELFATALSGKVQKLQTSLANVRMNKDGHQILALLASQAVNLYALKLGLEEGISSAEVAKELGVHPFALSQLEAHAKRHSRQELAHIVQTFADVDVAVKSGTSDPWTHIEITLAGIATRVNHK